MDRRTIGFFGFGGIALGVIGNAVTYFLLIYYNQVLAIPAHYVSLALGIALVFDAVSDPLIGMLSDRTRTRWGRRHPYLYLSAVPLALLYFLLWNPPDWALASNGWAFAYLTVLLVVFRTVFTCVDIPSNAMVPELTPDYDMRTRMMSARVSMAWAGGIAFTVLMYGYFLQPSDAYPDGILNPEGYRAASWIGAILVVASVLISALGMHRYVPLLSEAREARALTLREALATVRGVFASDSFRALMLYALAYRSTDGFFAALVAYMWTYFWLIDTTQIAILSAVNFLGALVAMAVAPRFARNHDKRTIVIWTNLGFLLTGCIPIVLRLAGLIPDEAVFPVLTAIAVFDITLIVVTLSLMNSMIADIVEDVQKTDGLRHEGAVVSAQTFVNKLSTAAGVWSAGLLISLVGFPAGVAVSQVPSEKVSLLASSYLGVLFLSIALCVLLLLRYKLGRQAHLENLRMIRDAAGG